MGNRLVVVEFTFFQNYWTLPRAAQVRFIIPHVIVGNYMTC